MTGLHGDAPLSSSNLQIMGSVPQLQNVLLLRQPRTPYEVVEGYPVPELGKEGEVLVQLAAIGLNPIDWKAP
jgi:hypothetical protein